MFGWGSLCWWVFCRLACRFAAGGGIFVVTLVLFCCVACGFGLLRCCGVVGFLVLRVLAVCLFWFIVLMSVDFLICCVLGVD